MGKTRNKLTLKQKILAVAAFFVLTILAAGLFLAVYYAYAAQRIDRRFEQLHMAHSTQFFAVYPSFHLNQRFSKAELMTLVVDQGYVERSWDSALTPGEYAKKSGGGILELKLFRPPFKAAGRVIDQRKARLVFQEVGSELTLIELTRPDINQPIAVLENLPKRLGAFAAGRLRTQDSVPLSQIPVSLRLAVMAIEDRNFLEHHGLSIRGTARAFWEDLKAMNFAQGGSTLTQQLMKNLFFSKRKAIARKVLEAFYAFVTESRHSKEEILEAYLNEMYLGQWGTREIHGFSEGARYYFNRAISQLTLSQSALLAAILQAPNAHNPHRQPERATKRRNLVLKQMLEAEFILPAEYEQAIQTPLGIAPEERTLTDVYYAIDLVTDRLPESIKSRMETEALTIYVTINPYLQALAAETLQANLERLKKHSKVIQENEAKGIPLESALIAVNVKNCTVLALQGGRSYQQTQFNRVLYGKRQPGSLFKPFVYLSAFRDEKIDPRLTPLTEIEDSPFTWEYEGQTWSPRNYDGKYRGFVSLRQGLEGSINVPTAKLAQLVGVSEIQDTLVRAGIRSPIPKVPSIALGSAEVSPLEMAEAFTTLANLGEHCQLRPYVGIYDENGNQIRDNQLVKERVLPADSTFQTVNIMKGVLTHGTAKWFQKSGIDLSNFAGKTGTTNDNKDAWFAGFSPSLLVLIWVGYDSKEVVGHTGSFAAAPLWLNFIRRARLFTTQEDWEVPEGLVPILIDRESNARAVKQCKQTQVEYFKEGSEPKSECSLLHID